MCQIYEATECPDIWLNSMLGVFKMFLDVFNIYINMLSKADCLL